MKPEIRLALAGAVAVAAAHLLTGCVSDGSKPGPCCTLLTGFDVPECVLVDPVSDAVYVANVEAAENEYWSDDGRGYITRIDSAGRRTDRWCNSTPEAVLNAPKGMCRLGDRLYFTDNTRLMSCDIATGGDVTTVATGFGKANDLATDGKAVWLSDTVKGEVWAFSPDGSSRRIPAPASVNGLTFHDGRLYAVSWDLHEVFELDPGGTAAPKPFGLADHFVNLDGIEVLDDGSFVVSDFVGNKVSLISPDRETVMLLAPVRSPADLGLDRRRNRLYVPLFYEDQVAVIDLDLALLRR